VQQAMVQREPWHLLRLWHDAALVAVWEGEAWCGACDLTPCGIGAAGSGSEARADAGGSQVPYMVRRP
jgi:hypothetical protein